MMSALQLANADIWGRVGSHGLIGPHQLARHPGQLGLLLKTAQGCGCCNPGAPLLQPPEPLQMVSAQTSDTPLPPPWIEAGISSSPDYYSRHFLSAELTLGPISGSVVSPSVSPESSDVHKMGVGVSRVEGLSSTSQQQELSSVETPAACKCLVLGCSYPEHLLFLSVP